MKKNYLICLLLIGFLSACNVLDQEPISSTTEANAWKTESDAIAEVNGIYAIARMAVLGPVGTYAHWSYGDFRFGDLEYGIVQGYIDKLELKNSNYSIQGLTNWSYFYRAIVQCNLVLEKVPTIDDSKFSIYPKAHYLAEAHFMRALLYFYVSRVWGEAPLQLEATNQEPLPRVAMDSLLNQAIRDCKKAIPGLLWRNTDREATVKAVKATRGAAYTLLSEIYMWKEEYASSLQASKAVMDSLSFSGYELMPLKTAADNDFIFNGRTNEGIFEFDLSDEFQEVPVNSASGSSAIANIALCFPPHVINYEPSSSLSIAPDTLNSLFPGNNPDRRRSLWFDESNVYSGKPVPMLIKYKNKSPLSTAKYPRYQDNVIIFRLAGLYLLRAEALANTGAAAEASKLLNDVRERAGATPYTQAEGDLLKAICQERRKELIGEGQVWYDMVRNGRLLHYKKHLYSEGSLRDGAWTWPVDPTSMITNSKLEQMPFWL